jgi:hypothetical protein
MREKKKTPLETYRPADTYFIVNDADPDLRAVRISLPSPPPIELIDNYGLPNDEQYFRHVEIPLALKQIENDAFDICVDNYKKNSNNAVTGDKLLRVFWELFDRRRADLEKEAAFIKKIHWYRTYGYWFLNDGKPTYIPPDYYDFLNFYRMADTQANGGRPEYRDDDRKKYLYWHYLETTTETFADLDEDGNALRDENGNFKMVDTGVRVFFGGIEPKVRRSGATHQGCHKVLKGCTSLFNQYGTIISMDGGNAETHYFKKLMPAFEKYPMFLKPTWDGNYRPRALRFSARMNEKSTNFLGSVIDYTESAGERKNDGDKLHYYLCDEEGKCGSGTDVLERWNVNKFTQSTGNGSNIFGFCLHPSTVEQMDEGGLAYYKLCKMSDFYSRIPGKYQTPSGLGLIFFPAYRKLENFIDRFGFSVVHKPTERQKRLSPDSLFAKMNIGALEYVMKDRDALLSKGTPEALETYRSIRRKMPIQFAECWLGTSGDLGFDLEIVDRRMTELRRQNDVIVGDLIWDNGIIDSRVTFQRNPEGRFEVRYILPDAISNKQIKEPIWVGKTKRMEHHYAPMFPERFTLGVDTFGYDNKSTAKLRMNKSRQSDGGMAVLWERDKEKDPGDDMREWDSFIFVLSYRYRPLSTDDFNEDVLKAAVYYGATVYIERNKENTWQYFIDRGYGGYLQYDIDPVTGRRAEKPGVFSLEKSKEVLFSLTKDYIRYRGHKEGFLSYLQEVKSIQGVEEMTLNDRFTAHGLCLMGSRSKIGSVYHQKKVVEKNSENLSGAIRFLRNRR